MKYKRLIILSSLVLVFSFCANCVKAPAGDPGSSEKNPAGEESPASPSSPDPAPDPDPEESVTPELPILAWYSVPVSYTSRERYQELKDAGFNITYSSIYEIEDCFKALKSAESVGIKALLYCTALVTTTESAVSKLKDHPALWGYSLGDEPGTKDYFHLSACAERIRSVDEDPSHMIYVNLFPNYAPESALGADYATYVHRFVDEVKLPMLSFDHYPVLTSGIRQSWWQNLDVISQEAERGGIPFYAFALCTAHDDYPVATLESLRIQMYTNLAYGAQGVQYFTYWCPEPGAWDFNNAPITVDGRRTPVYDIVKTMNAELQARAFVFVGAKKKAVYHTGETLPPGVKELGELPAPLEKLDTHGKGTVVSFLDNGNIHYLMIVNRSLKETVDVDLSFSKIVSTVGRDGKVSELPSKKTRFTLGKGDCALFSWGDE